MLCRFSRTPFAISSNSTSILLNYSYSYLFLYTFLLILLFFSCHAYHGIVFSLVCIVFFHLLLSSLPSCSSFFSCSSFSFQSSYILPKAKSDSTRHSSSSASHSPHTSHTTLRHKHLH